jgi:hypothetical protein
MLEQMFSEQSQEPSDVPDHKARNNKRRKMDVTTNSTPVHDIDDEDDVYYASVQGKKSKGGVGYAGDQKEDVSFSRDIVIGFSSCVRILGR